MLNCCFDITAWGQGLLGLSGVVLSFVGCRQAFKARKEIASVRMKENQEIIMSKLVAYFNSTLFVIRFSSLDEQGYCCGSEGPLLRYNLFEIGKLAEYGDTGYGSENDNDEKMMWLTMTGYDEAKVVLDPSYHCFLNAKEFIDDAYIPSSVADALCLFTAKYSDIVEFPLKNYDNNKLVIVIPNGNVNRVLTYKRVCVIENFAFISWQNFKNMAHTLTESIIQWYTINGIKNPNLRMDFKNGINKTQKYDRK